MQVCETCSKVKLEFLVLLGGYMANAQNTEFNVNQLKQLPRGSFMSPINWKSCFVGALVATAVSLPLVGSTQALAQVLSAQERRIRIAQESQERIDGVVKNTRSL